MSQFFFNANNKVGDTWSFQTNLATGDTQDLLLGGVSTMLYDMGIGESYFVGNPGFAIYQPYSGGATGIKTVTLNGASGIFGDITSVVLNTGFPYGYLDFTGWNSCQVFNVQLSPELSGITFPVVDSVNQVAVNSCDIQGNLDLTNLTNMGGLFWAHLNSNLTGITHTASTQAFTFYRAYTCDLTGTLDLSMLSGLGGQFDVRNNSNLTEILNPTSTTVFSKYDCDSCDLRNLDVSGLSGLGGTFDCNNNPNLTAVTHGYSTQVFTSYDASSCDITGVHDVSMLTGLGGTFDMQQNSNLINIIHTATTFTNYNVGNSGVRDLDLSEVTLGGTFGTQFCSSLTAITHGGSTNDFTSGYYVSNCDLTGTHDFSPLSGEHRFILFHTNPNLTDIIFPATTASSTGNFQAYSCDLRDLDMSPLSGVAYININNNPNLTAVTHASSSSSGAYDAFNCDLQGTLDLSMLSGRSGTIKVFNNTGLRDVVLPHSTGTFGNASLTDQNSAFAMYNCNLDYIDFKPLSAATMTSTFLGTTFNLYDNGMNTDAVNHILADFELLASLVPSVWTGLTVNIGGTNNAPDGSSGGYNGTAATISLIASGWTVTTS